MKWPKASRYLLSHGYDPSTVFVDGIFSDGFVSHMKPRSGASIEAPTRRTHGALNRPAYIHKWNVREHPGFSYHALVDLAYEDARTNGTFPGYYPRGGSNHSGETFISC